MHKIFRYPKFSETLKGCPRNFSALWDQKFLTEKVIPPFSSIKLFETRNFFKNSRSPLRNFSALWDIKISTENRDMPPLIHKFFFDTKNFLENRRVPLQSFSFRSCETKNFDKTVMPPPPSYAWKFSINKFSESPKCSPIKYFGTVRQKLFDGKSWYLPPLIHKKFFPTRNFLKHRMVPWRSFFGPVR